MLFLEEIPRTDPDRVQGSFLVPCNRGYRLGIGSNVAYLVVCVLRANVRVFNTEPHGWVHVIGQIDDILLILLRQPCWN